MTQPSIHQVERYAAILRDNLPGRSFLESRTLGLIAGIASLSLPDRELAECVRAVLAAEKVVRAELTSAAEQAD